MSVNKANFMPVFDRKLKFCINQKEKMKKQYKTTPEQRQAAKEWQRQNRAYMKAYLAKWRAENPDYQKKYIEKNHPGGNNCVYVLRNTETGRLKVGKGNPTRRLATCQTGTDCLLELIGGWKVDGDPHLVESQVKTACEQFHVRGEWFTGDALPSMLAVLGNLKKVC